MPLPWQHTFCHFQKCFLHIYTLRPTLCAKCFFPHNFGHNMLLPWQQAFRHYWKCVSHIYTSRPTCIPNYINLNCFWNHCFSCFFNNVVTMVTNIPALLKMLTCTSTPQGQHVYQISFGLLLKWFVFHGNKHSTTFHTFVMQKSTIQGQHVCQI